MSLLGGFGFGDNGTINLGTSNTHQIIVGAGATKMLVDGAIVMRGDEIAGEDSTTPTSLFLRGGNSTDAGIGGGVDLDGGTSAGGADGPIRIGTFNASAVTIGNAASDLGFHGAAAVAKQTVTGSRGGNAALASLLTALDALGIIVDSSSA